MRAASSADIAGVLDEDGFPVQEMGILQAPAPDTTTPKPVIEKISKILGGGGRKK